MAKHSFEAWADGHTRCKNCGQVDATAWRNCPLRVNRSELREESLTVYMGSNTVKVVLHEDGNVELSKEIPGLEAKR